MALDYMAIITRGVYPTSATSTQRAAFIITDGLMNLVPEGTAESSIVSRILEIGKSGVRFAQGLFKIG